jgi:hypothetical protein
MPTGLDDPSLTQKIDQARLRNKASSGSPPVMTYRHLSGEESGASSLPPPQGVREGPARVPLNVKPAAVPPGGVAPRGTSPASASPPVGADPLLEPAPPRRRYRVLRRDNGEEEVLDKQDLVRRIRDGRLIEDDRVAREDEDWTRAGDLPELARYFSLAAASGTGAPRMEPSASPGMPVPLACAQHPDRPARWQCHDCEKGLCQECTEIRETGMSEMAVCRLCGGATRVLNRARETTPFWQDIPKTLRYCLDGWGAVVMTIIYAILYWVAMFALKAPMPGMFRMYLMGAAAMVLLLLVTFDMLVVRATTDGKMKMPDWPDFSDWGEIMGKGIKGFAIWLAVHLPILLFNFWLFGQTLGLAMSTGPKGLLGLGALFILGNLALLVAAFVFYPMCFALVANFQSVRLALNPSAVLGSIKRILPEYLVFLALYFGLILAAKATHFTFFLILPFGAGIFGALIHAYSRLTSMHLLGRVIYQTEYKIGWDE